MAEKGEAADLGTLDQKRYQRLLTPSMNPQIDAIWVPAAEPNQTQLFEVVASKRKSLHEAFIGAMHPGRPFQPPPSPLPPRGRRGSFRTGGCHLESPNPLFSPSGAASPRVTGHHPFQLRVAGGGGERAALPPAPGARSHRRRHSAGAARGAQVGAARTALPAPLSWPRSDPSPGLRGGER